MIAASATYLATGILSNLVVAGPGYTNRIGNGVGTDFPAFYAAAVETRAGHVRAIYDMDALQAAHRAVRGVEVKPYAWAYPPTVLLFIVPLSLLPLVPAMWTWLGVTLAALLAACWRILPSLLTPLLVMLFSGVASSMVTGPTGTFVAAIVATGLSLLPDRPRLAGAVFALLTVKPHMAILPPLCLLAAGELGAVGAFGIAAAGLVAASVLAFGIDPWRELVTALPRHMDLLSAGAGRWTRMPTVYSSLLHASGNVALAWRAQLATSALVVLACVWVWRRTREPLARSLVLCAAMPLIGPYAWDYDTCVLIVPVLHLAHAFLEDRRVFDGIMLVVLWLCPVALWLVSTALGQQIGPVILLGAIAVAIKIAGDRPLTT